jgi:hypothetical protein
MSDLSADFGTGLRAHLGLEQDELERSASAEPAPEQEPEEEAIPDIAAEHEPETESAMLETLIAFEAELLDRERALAHREANFAGRAGALLAAAKELYDDVLAGKAAANHDELARMRRRKSGAA